MQRTLRRYWPILAVIAGACVIFAVYFVADQFLPDESYPRTNYSRIEDGLYLGGILAEPPPAESAGVE